VSATATAAPPVHEPGELARPGGRRERQRSRRASLALRGSGPLVLLVGWWIGSATGVIPPSTLSGPEDVWRALRVLIESGDLRDALLASLRRAGLGLAIGATLGLVLGLLAGLSRLGEELLDPSLQMLRTVPFVTLVPLFIVWFGIDELSKIALVVVGSTFPMYLNVYGGVRNVDRKVVEAGRMFGLSRGQLIRRIVLPAALPSICVGLRFSAGVAIIALVFAEQVNTTVGIGYLLAQAQQMMDIDTMVVCILVYACLGLAVDGVVRLIERFAMPWRTGIAVR
jgi:sulfonate transport system permease protein